MFNVFTLCAQIRKAKRKSVPVPDMTIVTGTAGKPAEPYCNNGELSGYVMSLPRKTVHKVINKTRVSAYVLSSIQKERLALTVQSFYDNHSNRLRNRTLLFSCLTCVYTTKINHVFAMIDRH